MILKMVSVCMDASSDYIYGSSVTLVISSELIVELCYNYSFISCDVLLVNFSRNEYSIVNGQIRRFHFSFLSFFLSFFFFPFSDSYIVLFIRGLNFSATRDQFHIENWNFVVGKYWTGHATFLTLVDENFFLKSPIRRRKSCAQFYLPSKTTRHLSLSLSSL